jgi:hypothetical protein
MIKVESILKWKVEGPILKKLKMIRSQILSKNSDAVALSDEDLHVTLASGPGWQKLKNKVKASDFDEPEFSIEVEPNFKVMEQGPKKSWYIKMKGQQDWKEYVMDLLQGTHDTRRVYHISIANLTGKTGDSVAMVEDRDYKDEYKKFQSSKKSKKYRAELNRYNRHKGTYGNRDGKDASHRNGKIVGFEDESTNRGRAEKSRLPKKEIKENMKTFEDHLKEGIHDPGIFKAFFTAGGPGSGKSHVASLGGLGGKGGSPYGLVVINSDDQFERLLKKAGMKTNPKDIYSERGQALRKISKRQVELKQTLALKGRLGVLIDGTGKKPNKIASKKRTLENLGYDCYMLFVDTALEVAIERDAHRKRTLGKEKAAKLWNQVQLAKPALKKLFGSDFIEIDNNHYTDDIKSKFYVAMGKLINTPPKKREATAWIKQQMRELGITRL